MNLQTTFICSTVQKDFFLTFCDNKVKIEMLAGVYHNVTVLTHYL